jgi:hypothetical protein
MPDSDSLYHRLFDHPEMVAELVREFLAGPWLDDLDLDGMTRENAKYHAATGATATWSGASPAATAATPT